ncbi:MAG: LysR substrate-binding domain-containing protein [Huintestinicola sp.]
MTDIKLKTFVCLVNCGSYTKAAELLHMTQPAVSQHIKKLENEYGCRLFEGQGALKLSERGKILYEYARLTAANEETLRLRLSNAAPPLKIGATLTIADHYLDEILPLITRLGDGSSHSGLHIYAENTRVLTEMMMQGEISCAFVEGIFDTSLFASHEFCSAALVGVCSAKHPLAGRETSFEELFGYPLILRESGSGTRAVFEEYLAIENLSLSSWKRVICAGSVMLIKKILSLGEGISFMYSRAVERDAAEGRLAFLKIRDFSIEKPLHFIYPKSSACTAENEQLFRRICSELKLT